MPGITLSAEQRAAADQLCTQMARGGFSPFLLDGVTGSGKTEVYFEAIAAALRASPGAQVLVLLPEIALTQAVLERFETRFGAVPAPWHSGLGEKARRRTWREVAHGRAQIVIGARSALFLPFRHLALIIVDEEHDGSYKQEEGVTYHARDMAVMRAKLAGAAIVLASATPALETAVNAESGRYELLRLQARPGASRLPDIDLIDLRARPPEKGSWLSPGSRRSPGRDLCGRRAIAPVSQPARLCPAGALPRLRGEAEKPRHGELADRASLYRAPGLSPDRLFHAETGGLPALRG